MNSKFVFFILFFLAGCGVKSDPLIPPNTQIPSYIDPFTNNDYWEEEESSVDKNKAKGN